MASDRVVSEEEWIEARRNVLEAEKRLTAESDRVAEMRRQLPWLEVKEEYVFRREGLDGAVEGKSLGDLFGDKDDLIVVHLMFEEGWQKPCKNCSFWADQYDGVIPHLTQKTSFAVIAQASPGKLKETAVRKGWCFPLYSHGGTSFGRDMGVEFTAEQLSSGLKISNYGSNAPFGSSTQGMTVFHRSQGRLFRTYSLYSRGFDHLNLAYGFLDLLPHGRDTAGPDASPYPMCWIKHKEEYADPSCALPNDPAHDADGSKLNQ